VGSPVTLSGFNKVDFTVILNAVMQQESAPLKALEATHERLKNQSGLMTTLATKLSAAQDAAEALTSTATFGGRSVTVTDTSIATVSPGINTPAGTYDIQVNELARAQVTATNSSHTDKDTTIVASSGTLTIGGVDVVISSGVTLQGLADAINGTNNMPVRASIVSPSAGTYQIVLTGNKTGSANAFTITNGLGAGVSFGANAVTATDASVVVNGITVSSDTNNVTNAIPDATIALLKKEPGTTVTASVTQDLAGTKTKLKAFVTAYNDLLKFAKDQTALSLKGDERSIGRDGVLRAARNAFSQLMSDKYDVGGTFAYAAEVGVSFTSTGDLQFEETVFNKAVENGTADVEKLFRGTDGTTGLFGTFATSIDEYVRAGGVVLAAQDRLKEEIASIDARMEGLEARLAVRRAALQREYISYDQTIAQLNSQAGSLTNLASSLF